MSFLSKAKTDFADAKALFVKLFNAEPAWSTVALADINYAAPVLDTVAELAGGPVVEAEVVAAIAVIKVDLVAATKFIQDANASPSLVGLLQAISTNLAGLLSLASIKNSAKLSTITAYVNGFIAEIEAILGALPKAA
jgi:hypothetical protein